MSLDFNDEETRRQHNQMISIFIANREGGHINSARADYHIETQMAGGKPSAEAIRAAATEFLVIWSLADTYRESYADEPHVWKK